MSLSQLSVDLSDLDTNRALRGFIANLSAEDQQILTHMVEEDKAIRSKAYNGAHTKERLRTIAMGPLTSLPVPGAMAAFDALAAPTGPVLVGDGTWPFVCHIDGDDLVVNQVYATWFGGDSDSQDNGETWSGVVTKGNPTCVGCALPLRNLTKSLTGSPIPDLPAKIQVRVYAWATHKSVTVPLIDIGPSKFASHPKEPHGIDLTVASFQTLGLSLNAGLGLVDYRVIGGAKYAPKS